MSTLMSNPATQALEPAIPVASPRLSPMLQHVALPALLILVVQVALYIWMAPRGFEFTDEAYYLHNFLYWREFTGNVTFFGAYFEWPFRLLGASIAGIRIFSLLLVLASALVLMRQLMRSAYGERFRTMDIAGSYRYMVVPMAAAMFFFGYLTTLRAPSYNLLCLVTMAVMTACMLNVVERRKEGRDIRAVAFAYGLALGACFLSKATTAALVTLLHMIFFYAINRDWEKRGLLGIVTFVTAGFAFNFLVLTLALPSWFDVLREGIVITNLRDQAYSFLATFKKFRWQLLRELYLFGSWMIGPALILVLTRKKVAVATGAVRSLLVMLLAAAMAYSHLFQRESGIWLMMATLVVASFWDMERLARRGQPAQYDERAEFALMLLLLLSPLAFSYGTNLSVLGHSAIAALFAYAALCLRLYRLGDTGVIGAPAFAAALAILCTPPLAIQYRALTDVDHTYRQQTALAFQDMPIVLGTGKSVVYVDPNTRRSLRAMQDLARQAGMLAGHDLLDLTGDGPGVTYAIGARPLGSPWMLGGYPGSAAAIERVIQKVDIGRVRKAWLITSTDNPRRVRDWAGVMHRRIGADTHELAGSIVIINPHFASNNEPDTVNLQLWKPSRADQPAIDAER